MISRQELERVEREVEMDYKSLLKKAPEQAAAFQENALRLLGIAEGTITPVYKVLHLVNGAPAPATKKKEMPPAA